MSTNCQILGLQKIYMQYQDKQIFMLKSLMNSILLATPQASKC